MFGSIALTLTFTASLAAIILYTLAARGRTEFLVPARRTAQLAVLGMLTACAVLLYYIFGYHFEINYVYEHAARRLSTFLLFSVFYASQEGSFMLWGLWTSLIAIVLIPYARRQRYEAHVMAVFLSVLVFISIMLLAKSPFETIYAAHPGEAIKGFIPADGKGLNPSLENLWIVIHPPMLFLGFSLLAVPFSFAMAGLFKRDYQGWVLTSMPWTLGAAMVLGFGVMLGGFWAYETLGWGGYWAWDPVENASLLPWLMTVAAAHSMLTQKRTGGLIKTNISLTLLAYALVLYGSFLTRSGVLGEASVHSFADPGNLAFSLLVIALGLFTLAPFGVLAWRWREMSGFSQNYRITSRETALALASALLGASALVVFIGTSAPLLKKKVDADFYNNLHIPIVIALMAVNGLSLLLKWKHSDWREVAKKSVWGLLFAGVFTAVVAAFGVHNPGFIGVVAAASFALFINIEIGWSILKGHWAFSFVRMSVTRQDYLRRIFTAFGITALAGVLALFLSTAGDYNLFLPVISRYGLMVVLLFCVLSTGFVIWGYPRFIFDTKFLGAYVAHAGMAIFVLGVIASAGYTDKEIIRLPQNEPAAAFGGKYSLMFTGDAEGPNARTYFPIRIYDQNKRYTGTAQPLVFRADASQGGAWIRNPGIVKYAARDLYFTVNESDLEGGTPKDTLGKMESVSLFHDSVVVTFVNFDFPQSERMKMMSQQPFHVTANVEAKVAGTPFPLTLGVTRNPATDEVKEDDIVVPNTPYHVQLDQLMPNMQDPTKSRVVLRVFDSSNPPSAPTEVITVEAFVKPYINLVWAGILTLVLGFGFSVIRRRREALAAIERAERAYQRRKGAGHGGPRPDALPLLNVQALPNGPSIPGPQPPADSTFHSPSDASD